MKAEKRRPLVAGNWKLNMNIAGSAQLVREIKRSLPALRRCEVAVAPVFTALRAVYDEIAKSQIKLAAQDVYWEEKGAFTGEVSASLLKDVGCEYVIVGHSERRQMFGETDISVNKKTKAVIVNEMTAITCVGETREQREAGKTLQVVLSQVDGALKEIQRPNLLRIVIAYEPVWAIGTGLTASPSDAQQVHGAIRNLLVERFGAEAAESVPILYGGSVKPDNAASLMEQPDVDGALVGGASLVAESFLAIVRAADK